MAAFYVNSPVRPDGPLLAGRNRLTHLIGGGSQGVVLVGRDLTDQRDVAVKMFDPTERTIDDCVSEARALGTLESPHIVKCHGIGFADGTAYMVFERIDGPAVQMHRQATPFGRPTSREAARITLSVLAALAECHDKGLVHGSPHQNNVMLRGGVEPVLIDFGRVLPIGATDKATPTRDVAEARQLLNTLLTGHTPHAPGQSEQLLLLEGCAAGLMAAMGIDGALAAIAIRALNRDQAARYQDAGAMRRELAAHPLA